MCLLNIYPGKIAPYIAEEVHLDQIEKARALVPSSFDETAVGSSWRKPTPDVRRRWVPSPACFLGDHAIAAGAIGPDEGDAIL